jgi:hypothetical protein
MPPPLQPEPTQLKSQQQVEKLSKCIQYIKSSEGGAFKTFGLFMNGLFTELPVDGSSTNIGAQQTVRQTVRSFLTWNPLKAFLDKVSSHPVMKVEDGNTEGIVPSYSVSPGLPAVRG